MEVMTKEEKIHLPKKSYTITKREGKKTLISWKREASLTSKKR